MECGVNRVLIRSITKAGKITVTAQAEGLPTASVTLKTIPVKVTDGLSEYLPQATLKGRLDKGETPLTPSYIDTKREVTIVKATAGSNLQDVEKSYDDNELSEWCNDGELSNAWITYTLEREAKIDDICIKLSGWRSRSYPLEIYAGDTKIWEGDTDKSLGYIHLQPIRPIRSDKITIRLKGSITDKDAFGQIVEVAGGTTGEIDKKAEGKNSLHIVEVEFLEKLF